MNDPIRFQKSIKVTIEHGHNNDLANDYSSVAYWYQAEPHKPFRPLLPVEERLPLMPDTYWEIEARDREAQALWWEALRQEIEVDFGKLVEQVGGLHASLNKAFGDQDYRRAGELAGQIVEAYKG